MITEVRVKLVAVPEEPPAGDKLLAFCSITLDDAYVIRDLKIIDSGRGPFVAMPSRRLMERCPRCGGKNHMRARYCNDCGTRITPARSEDGRARLRLHADIAHPINSKARADLERAVIDAYEQELDRGDRPEYTQNAEE